MPRYKVTATIEVEMEITAETADHARYIFDNINHGYLAEEHGALKVDDVELIIPEPKSWSRALGPVG